MSVYRRDDDGAEMIETKPGCWVRRDVALALGLAIRTVGATGRAAGFAPARDPQPDPVEVPPLQPSHGDLVSAATAAATIPDLDAFARTTLDGTVATLGLTHEQITADLPPAKPVRASKPLPAKRSISAILADSHRRQRKLHIKVKV